MAKAPSRVDESRTTGRGFLVITGAKAWFFVSAAILNFGLPKLLASQAEYGTYGVVINAVSLLNMVVITGTMQAVAKLVSERPEATRAIASRATVVQLGIGFPLAAAYFALAGPIAAWLKAPSYAPLLRISALIVAGYSFYAVYVGCFNGRKAFTRQAALDILFATLRVAGILGMVALGFGVAGAIWAFAVAAFVILGVSVLWLRRWLRRHDTTAQPSPHAEGRRLAAFLVSTMVYTFVLNLVMRVDLFTLKRFSAQALEGGGVIGADASNALAGAYTLMLNVARLPYQGVIAIAFVIFPLLSKSTFDNDQDATRAYIRDTMRYALMLVGLFAAVLAVAAGDLLRPLYPDYAYANGVLLELCLGYALFALLYIATTVFIAAGHPWLATLVTLITTAALAALCWVLIPAAEPGPDMLDAAALSVLVAMALGLTVSGLLLVQRYGAFMKLKVALRLLAIIGAVIAVGAFTDFARLFDFVDPLPVMHAGGVGHETRTMMGSRLVWLGAGLGKAAGLAILYVILLFVSGEIGPDDRARVARVIGRRKRLSQPPTPTTESATKEPTS